MENRLFPRGELVELPKGGFPILPLSIPAIPSTQFLVAQNPDCHYDGCALLGFREDAQVPPVFSGDTASHTKAQTLAGATAGSKEGLGSASLHFVAHPHTVITDPHEGLIVLVAFGDCHLPAIGEGLDGVEDDVDECFF